MRNFVTGLVVSTLGAILLVVGRGESYRLEFADGQIQETPVPFFIALTIVGALVMVLGLILFWFVIPVVGWFRRRGRRES